MKYLQLDEALRVQTSLAKADHYPHIAKYEEKKYALMNVGPWWKGSKVLDHYMHSDEGMPKLLPVFFFSFAHLRRSRLPQNI